MSAPSYGNGDQITVIDSKWIEIIHQKKIDRKNINHLKWNGMNGIEINWMEIN